ncbi:MAG: PilZ domain-containing protein [Nitrospirae bacterium]|nr:PilZ domain-containing protein [Nitrospirota bacterium]
MEKRRAKRTIKRLSITFSDGNEEYNGTSSNLSVNGLFIRTRKAFKVGALLKMVLETDKGQSINLTGVVARAIKTGIQDFKNGMGIRLVNAPQDYVELVSSLLSGSAQD